MVEGKREAWRDNKYQIGKKKKKLIFLSPSSVTTDKQGSNARNKMCDPLLLTRVDFPVRSLSIYDYQSKRKRKEELLRVTGDWGGCTGSTVCRLHPLSSF